MAVSLSNACHVFKSTQIFIGDHITHLKKVSSAQSKKNPGLKYPLLKIKWLLPNGLRLSFWGFFF